MLNKPRLAVANALLATPLVMAGCSTLQPAPPAAVIEIATFQLADGVTADAFRPLDTAVEVEHVSRQPGFIARESAASEDGEWAVVVHWASLADADASMSSFASAPAAAEFMSHIKGDTMVMKRYKTD